MATTKTKLKKTSTDDEIKAYMLDSINIEDWNNRRNEIKAFRDDRWIGANIDSRGFIHQAHLEPMPIPKVVEEEVPKLTDEEIAENRLQRLSGGSDKLRDFYKTQRLQP